MDESPLLAVCESELPYSQKLAAARLLLNAGANCSLRTRDGKTVAQYLIERDTEGLLSNDEELVRLLNASVSGSHATRPADQ